MQYPKLSRQNWFGPEIFSNHVSMGHVNSTHYQMGQRSSGLASPCALSLKPQTRLPNATDNLPIKMTLLTNRECCSKADPPGLRNTATRGSPSSGSPPGSTSRPTPIFSHARKRHPMTYARRRMRKKPEGNPGSFSYAHHFHSSLQGYPSGRPKDVFHHAN